MFLSYDINTDGDRATICHARAQSAAGRVLEWNARDCLPVIFQDFCNHGAAVVWVWNISEWGCFCDYYALKNGMINYDVAQKQNDGRKVAEPCYNILYTGGGVLMFRLTLKRTAKTHDFGGGKIGGLHTVEYRGLQPFFRGRTFEETAADMGAKGDNFAAVGMAIYDLFVPEFARLTGENLEDKYTLRNVYTIGGAAKRKYMLIKYGGRKSQKYFKDFPQYEDTEDYFRAHRLLLSGMCFYPFENEKKLIQGTIYKWDVNGLYSDTANRAGALGMPKTSTYEEFRRDKSGEFVYIIVARDIALILRQGMPPAFSNPFTHTAGKVLQITNEWAVFGELWEALHDYYIFEDFEILRVYKCRRIPDPAIIEYNDFFVKTKVAAKKADNMTAYMLSKLFLNTLPGKMVQRTKYVECTPYYDAGEDSVIFTRGETIDKWETGHFDFIRGAYIYTRARVKIMRDICELIQMYGGGGQHFYTDTDSIITDMQLPPAWVDAFKLGLYKLEETYTAFAVYCRKIYYGRTIDGQDKLTAAGVKKAVIIKQIYDTYGHDLTAGEFWTAFTTPRTYDMPELIRMRGGAGIKNIPVKISEIDFTPIL